MEGTLHLKMNSEAFSLETVLQILADEVLLRSRWRPLSPRPGWGGGWKACARQGGAAGRAELPAGGTPGLERSCPLWRGNRIQQKAQGPRSRPSTSSFKDTQHITSQTNINKQTKCAAPRPPAVRRAGDEGRAHLRPRCLRHHSQRGHKHGLQCHTGAVSENRNTNTPHTTGSHRRDRPQKGWTGTCFLDHASCVMFTF